MTNTATKCDSISESKPLSDVPTKPFKILGMEMAPVNIPIRRRLQTLAIFQWVLCFLFAGFGALFFMIYLLFTDYFWVPLLYGVWYIYDRNISEQGGRPSEILRGWKVWKYFRDYFPIRLIKTAELDPNKNYILGYHPHGVMCTGAFCNFGTSATGFTQIFPGMRPILLTLAGQFMFPLQRDYFLRSGACSCTKESISWLLTKAGTGNALVLIVGGAVEALAARPGSFLLNMKTRKGFIKIALKHGTSLVPMYSFGENDIYTQVPNPPGSRIKRLQEWMTNKLGFSPPIFHARGIFQYTYGIVPYRRPINTVVGSPIDVPRIESPTQEEIDKCHQTYLDALVQLFEENKTKYGVDKDQHLEIV